MSIANSIRRALPGKTFAKRGLPREAFAKWGFAPLAILVLLLAVAGLGAAVLTVSQQTGLLNFAAQNRLTLQGQITKVTPCKNTIICHQLTNSSDGVNHYLVSGRKIGSEKINLDKYIGKLVEIQGVEVAKRSTSPYILVQSIKELSSTNITSPTSLPVTEFGTIVKGLTPVPVPTPGPVTGGNTSGGGSTGTTGPGQQTTTCQYKPSGDPICPQTMVYPDCPNGKVVQPDGKDKCGCPFAPVCQYLPPNPGPSPVPPCRPRPPCLDNPPYCRIAEPVDGWCPPTPVKPPCQLRPCCLDTNPRCLPPTPEGGWCPQPNPACPGPVPIPVPPSYDLRTEDGRVYHLVTSFSPPCLKNCPATNSNPQFANLEQYVGKTVLVEGIMRREASYWCPSNPKMGIPCRIAPIAPLWWPLPGNLIFEVQRVQEARRYSTATVTDLLDNSTGKYQNENVYVFRSKLPCTAKAGFPCPPAPDGQRDLKPGFPKIFVRSSKFDLLPSVGHQIRAGYAVYSVGPQVDIFLDVTQLDIIGPSHSVCRNSSCVEVPGAGPNTCANPEDCAPVTPPPGPPTVPPAPPPSTTCSPLPSSCNSTTYPDCIALMGVPPGGWCPLNPGQQCTKDSDCNPCRPPRMCAQVMPDATWSCIKGSCVVSNNPQ